MDDMEKECIIAEKKTNAIINLLILIVYYSLHIFSSYLYSFIGLLIKI